MRLSRAIRQISENSGGMLLSARLFMLACIALILTNSVPQLMAQQLPQPVAPPVSRIQHAVAKLDDQIGELLLNLPVGANQTVSAEEMEETYRLIIRHLYQSAMHCNNPALRSRIMLKADQLATGLPDFDKQIKTLLGGTAPANAAAVQACIALDKASAKVNTSIASTDDLNSYLHKMLKPLAPLAALQFTGPTPPVVWPVIPATGAQPIPLPSGNHLPDVTLEMSALQQANIMPGMRRVLRQILQQLQIGLNHRSTHRQSKIYYQVILQCVSLAEHLQQGTVLPNEVRQEFNHRLMLGLLFFKDRRTRGAAARKLEFIGTIVHSLELLQTVPLSPQAKSTITICMHDSIVKLQSSDHGTTYADRLRLMDKLLGSHQAFIALIRRAHAGYTDTAWRRIAGHEQRDLNRVITALNIGFDSDAIHRYLSRVAELTPNLWRLSAMPALAEQALLYHPQPADGVEQNMARWAVHIGMHPYQTGTAAATVDRFGMVLAILAATHREMAIHSPARLLKTLSGGRYALFVTDFLNTQRELANSLARPQIAPDKLLRVLRRQRLIFQVSAELAYLLGKDHPLLKLNQWAAWHVGHRTVNTVLNQFEQTLSSEYRTATDARKVTSDAWADFAATAPAIRVLADACRNVLPHVNAPLSAWSTGWLQAYSPPPDDAMYRTELSKFSMACMYFRSAQYNSTHESALAITTNTTTSSNSGSATINEVSPAPDIFVSGLHALARRAITTRSGRHRRTQ